MRITQSIPSAALALAIALGAGGAEAQTTAEVSITEVEALEANAHAYLVDLSKWERAARLFRRAADLRPEGDPAATEDLIYAARLSYYEGNERQAVRDFEAAGQRALAVGDVIVAANAFTDAAWIAQHRGYGERALALLSRAELLSRSPLIPEDERTHLRARWGAAGPQQ